MRVVHPIPVRTKNETGTKIVTIIFFHVHVHIGEHVDGNMWILSKWSEFERNNSFVFKFYVSHLHVEYMWPSDQHVVWLPWIWQHRTSNKRSKSMPSEFVTRRMVFATTETLRILNNWKFIIMGTIEMFKCKILWEHYSTSEVFRNRFEIKILSHQQQACKK